MTEEPATTETAEDAWFLDYDNDGLIVCTVCDGTEKTGHEDDCPTRNF